MPKSLTKEEVQRICQRTVDLILKEAGDKVKAILLFGSHADGTAIWRSDIDIAVILTGNPTNLEAGLFRKKMWGVLPEVVDIQVFNVLPLKIRKSIADNHMVLFKSNLFDDEEFIISNNQLFFELKNRKISLEDG